ncbi:hypothetical protein ACFSCX_20650 [Bacillus salitolerans]|uniref:Uncharacterized protein n=1 Tax=Bacillus salitolerans TaxID=1437434 RepID=A0ABW4LWL3_9BACI
MNKKEMLLHMINRFTEHATTAPRELLEELHQIKRNLDQLSNEAIEMLDGPTTIPAGDRKYDADNPLHLLYHTYGDMEKFAYTGEKDEDLYHVIQQMRGFFDIPDRYFP